MIEQNKNQQQQDNLLNIAHQNYLGLHESVALLANLKDELQKKLDYLLLESTENKFSDAEIRIRVVEVKCVKGLIDYVYNPKSIIRKGK